MIVNNSSSSSNIKLTRTDLWRTIAKDYSRDRTSLQSVLTSNNRSQQETATRPLVNVDRLRLDKRIENTDHEEQVPTYRPEGAGINDSDRPMEG